MSDQNKKDELTGKQINVAAETVASKMVGEIASKAINNLFGKSTDKKDSSKDNAQENEFITQSQLLEFGKGLVKEVVEANQSFVKSLQKSSDDSDEEDGDKKSTDKKGDVKKSTDNKDDKSTDKKNDSNDEIEKTVQAVLSKLGIPSSNTPVRKSYVVTDNGALIKKIGGELPAGAVNIDPNDIDMDEWNALPQNTKESILGDEFRARITPAR